MRSGEENGITSNKLLGVIYVLLHCSLSVQGPDKGLEGAAGAQLGTACMVSTRVCGILAHSQMCCPDQQHISAQGRLQGAFQGSLDRMLRVLRQMMNIQQGQANPILCVVSQEITPFLPVMLDSPACIRHFWDETFLGEWMSWQMLSAGNLLKRQLVRGYCSCSVEHSWFTQNGLKMQLSKMCFAKLFKAIK